MNGIAGYLAKAIVFIAIGVAVALAVVLPVVLPQRVSASANPVISYVQRGLIGSVNCSNYRDDPAWSYLWIEDSHPCWHADEPGDTSAIDYTVPGPPEASIGASVYFHYRGDSQNFVIDILPYYTPCTGVAAYLHNQQGYLRGTVNYVHIDVAGGVVGTIPSSFEWLGTVSGDQPDLCEETAWTGPHLHQSADSTGNNPFYFNRWDNPWKDHYHEHTIYWPALQSDADGDSYSDSMELRLGTDPQDACADTATADNERGFDFNEPVSPWPPDFDDNRFINILDVARVLPPYFGTVSGGLKYHARRDLHQGNGLINILDVGKVLPPVFASSCSP